MSNISFDGEMPPNWRDGGGGVWVGEERGAARRRMKHEVLRRWFKAGVSIAEVSRRLHISRHEAERWRGAAVGNPWEPYRAVD